MFLQKLIIPVPLFAADTVYRQKFDLSCDREVNRSSGLISYTFNWTLGPPDLPYNLTEAFEDLTLRIYEIPSPGTPIAIDTFNANEFRRREDAFILSSVPAVITLERNISGSLWIRDALPRFTEQTQFKHELRVRQIKFNSGSLICGGIKLRLHIVITHFLTPSCLPV